MARQSRDYIVFVGISKSRGTCLPLPPSPWGYPWTPPYCTVAPIACHRHNIGMTFRVGIRSHPGLHILCRFCGYAVYARVLGVATNREAWMDGKITRSRAGVYGVVVRLGARRWPNFHVPKRGASSSKFPHYATAPSPTTLPPADRRDSELCPPLPPPPALVNALRARVIVARTVLPPARPSPLDTPPPPPVSRVVCASRTVLLGPPSILLRDVFVFSRSHLLGLRLFFICSFVPELT